MNLNRYPLTTPAGVPIPLDVYRPKSLVEYIAAATPSIVYSMEDTCEVFIIRADADVYIRFHADPITLMSNGVAQDGVIFIGAGEIHNVSPLIKSMSFYGTVGAKITVTGVESWVGLGTTLSNTYI